MADGTSIEYVQRLKADLGAIESEHPGCSARIASGGGRMRVTMDRYEVRTPAVVQLQRSNRRPDYVCTVEWDILEQVCVFG